MAKKNGGFFNSIFDFNGDGITDIGEQFLAYKIFEECTKEDEHDYEEEYSWRNHCEDGSDFGIDPENYEFEWEYEEALNEAKYAWRETCADGSEFDISPDDFETEQEYNEALDEAKYAWRETCADGSDFDIFPDDFETEQEYNEALEQATNDAAELKESDFPNKRRYNAACVLADDSSYYNKHEQQEICTFIIEKADTVLAANYLSHTDGFLYSQAVKDNFDLPISLPDEDEKREFEFYEIIKKLAKKDIPLSFEVWSWALEQFLPYAEYDGYALSDLTSDVLDNCNFSEKYEVELARYMDKNREFCRIIVEGCIEASYDNAELIVRAIKENFYTMAIMAFETCITAAKNKWRTINNLVESIIMSCEDDEEVESIEFFRDNLFPIVKSLQIGMVQDEIEGWEKAIADYIDTIERESDKYAYSRRYAWRKTAPDGKEYDLDPIYYETEQEYLEAINEQKYSWREWYQNEDTLGLDVADYETVEEFNKALNARMAEQRLQAREQRKRERQQQKIDKQKNWQPERAIKLAAEKPIDDKTIYTICGVEFPHAARPYSYMAGNQSLKIGDMVLVPVESTQAIGTVVSIGQFLRKAAPFPIDKMKTVICKVEDYSEEI